MTLAATLTLSDAATTTWDALVVGAGPAGAIAAHELGRLGARTLLVDRSVFPRWKVCGCCLLEPGLKVLRRSGMGPLVEMAGAIPLASVRFYARGAHAAIPLRGGVAISREALDAALIHAALERGVQFLPETFARLHQIHSDSRELVLQQTHDAITVRARIVVSADGLGNHLIAQEPGVSIRVRRASRIGAGCTFVAAADACPPGTVEMACGRAGYAGLVRLSDGRVNCAAALDVSAVRAASGLSAAVGSIFLEAGLKAPAGIASANWRGTPALSRALSRHWAWRLFVVGDAAGYLEPFTGEGMSLAMASARALAPLALQATKNWDQRLGMMWESTYTRIVTANRGFLHSMAFLLKYPLAARWIVTVLSVCPALAAPMARRINGASIPLGG